MSTLMLSHGYLHRVVEFPADMAAVRGMFGPAEFPPITRALKPGDAVGVSTLAVSNLLAGSEVRLFVTGIGENPGGIESLSGASAVTFTYDVYPSPAQAFLVILLPGYHPIRLPFQLGKLDLAYTAFQVVDPAYLP